MSKPLNAADFATKKIKYIFTDIDDTLTLHGRLQDNAYTALWKLFNKGYKVIPVTGRPAGWCEMIARMWPVDAVIGENGGFYFSYQNNKMKRFFQNSENERQENQSKLTKIKNEVLSLVPTAAVASDQFTRLMDLAIDFCEDVSPLSEKEIEIIVETFKKHGATAKVSSIHVNGWFGEYSKISMVKEYCKRELNQTFDEINSASIFVGDSPNDEPSFKDFQTSVGVSNINHFLDNLKFKPTFITKSEGGNGFCELAKILLDENFI